MAPAGQLTMELHRGTCACASLLPLELYLFSDLKAQKSGNALSMHRNSIVRHTAALIGATFVASAMVYLVIKLIALQL